MWYYKKKTYILNNFHQNGGKILYLKNNKLKKWIN